MKKVKWLEFPKHEVGLEFLICEVGLRELELCSLVKRGLRGGIISSVCLNSYWAGVKNTLQ